MHKSFLKLLIAAVAMASLLTSSPSAFAQGITTAAINGFVTSNGQPVAGATVTLVHEPSGTRAVTTTRANGQYGISNLRVGGPYTVSVSASTYKTETSSDVFLDQGDSAAVNFALSGDVVQLDKISVTASRDGTFGSGKMGTGSTLTDRDIEQVATVRRSVQDIAVLDSRLFLGSLDQGGQLSAQGQNFRFNSFVVDGVQANDSFGLNSNGFSSQRSPIPLEAIQSFSVDLAPYDVRRAGFVGALLNAVIKSGTNEFHGSLMYEKTGEQWRQKNPLNNVREKFDERTFGLTVGGPIIRNKLFFFLAYDDFQRKTASPQANFVPDTAGLAQIAAIVARATALGYDAGSLSANDNIAKQKTYIGKLDWNISDKHRATVTYRRNHGEDTSFFNYTSSTATSLSSIWFQQPRNMDSYNGQLFSQWTPDFRTEATVSYTKYDGTPAPNGKAFPQVEVKGISGTRLDTGAVVPSGSVFFGTDASRQLNLITTKETQGKFNADYSIGDHTLSFGLEDIATKYNNAFVQNTNGSYTFANATTWTTGAPATAYQLQRPYAGHTLEESIARWSYDAYAAYIQDSWKPTQQLTLLAGLRYDYPYIPDAPPVAAGFSTAGFTLEGGRPVTANNTTNSGNATISPRVGFTYQLKTERKTQIRGGFGLFQGKSPAVYVSNAYSNAGATYNYTATPSDLAAITFNPNPNTQTVPGSANPAPNINITDPNFKQPALWKGNLGVDHKLPWGNLTVTAEYYYNQVEDAFAYQFLNYKIATDGVNTMPDGRTRYGSAASIVSSSTTNVAGRRRVATFADVYYMTNSNKGKSDGLTLQVARPMKNHWGWSLSYTRADATEVSPVTSSTAGSNYSNRAVFNPNEDVDSTSNTNIKDRVVISLTREFELVKRFKTTVSLIYQGRTGHPYSWVFYGDANGDGFAFNDLLYVPSGPSDPKVAWASATERDNFFAFVGSSTLANYMGKTATRNSEVSPWAQQLDLKLTQQLPIYGNLRAELYVNVLNFWNLFDKNWGSLDEVPFSYRRAVVGSTYTASGNGGVGVWNYTFTGTTLNGVPTTANDTPVSRWQAQAGIKIRF